MSSNGYVIDVHDVHKTFKKRIKALQGVDLQVGSGEIFGLLGPNGAGKSTLVKILMTVVRPDKINGTFLGASIGQKEPLSRVGYLPEHHHFPDYLTGLQVIEFSGAMCGLLKRDRQANARKLLDRVGMTKWGSSRLNSYSKGMLQRVGLAQALVNDPKLVVLDEPTDGVDPVGRREIRDLLLELRGEGRSIFLNSHLLSELEMVCDRVAIMVQGRVSMQGTIDELTQDSRRFEIDITGPVPEWLTTIPGVTHHDLLYSKGDKHVWWGKEDMAGAHLYDAEEWPKVLAERMLKKSLTVEASCIRVPTDDPEEIQ
ncbi:MAG: ABC transporter ATP-binding protein, partial [Planctomycetota bacterium]|nr:ABC transporter ATP-binding protein [Planctomycetota bacterium]